MDIAGPDELAACWNEAVEASGVTQFDPAFLRKEWETVILAGGVETLDAYLKVPRLGRGRTLTRPQRGRLWVVFQKYRQALERRHRLDWLSLIRQARHQLASGRVSPPYRAVVVDEAQDFHPEEWRLIRALVPEGANDIFIVGDAHQRIYGQAVSLSRCGIAIQGRSSRLRINYRTTEQIRAWAMRILREVAVDDLDGERDDDRGYRSLLTGPEPEVHHFAGRGDEHAFLAATLKDLTQERRPEEICLVARTHSLIKEYGAFLKNHNITHQVLDRGREKVGGGIRLATMHRVKGLEFPVMLLAGINAKTLPLRVPGLDEDPASRTEHEERERALLFVAATRARDRLIVSGFGSPSPYLRGGHE
jgi:superfamily I DNA/RNA helicase